MKQKEIILKIIVIFSFIGSGVMLTESVTVGFILNLIGCTTLAFLTPSKEDK